MEKTTGESHAVGIELTFLANMVSHMVDMRDFKGRVRKPHVLGRVCLGLGQFKKKRAQKKTRKVDLLSPAQQLSGAATAMPSCMDF